MKPESVMACSTKLLYGSVYARILLNIHALLRVLQDVYSSVLGCIR
jgi:hypothetical protein